MSKTDPDESLSSLEPEDFMDEARDGTISPQHLNFVVQRLQETYNFGGGDLDFPILAQTIGYVGPTKYKGLIEQFLYYPDNPSCTKWALIILCGFWKLSLEYIDTIKQFLKGVEWDTEFDVQLQAIDYSEDILRQKLDYEILQLLFNIIDNVDQRKETRAVRYKQKVQMMRDTSREIVSLVMNDKREELNWVPPYVDAYNTLYEYRNTITAPGVNKARELLDEWRKQQDLPPTDASKGDTPIESVVMDIDDLEYKARNNKISPEELEEIIKRLESVKQGKRDPDTPDLLEILRILNAKQYKPLIEQFLYQPTAPFTASVALRILCDSWGHSIEYLDNIKQFIRHVDWDSDCLLRKEAIEHAGKILKTTPDKELLQLLLDTFDEKLPSPKNEKNKISFESVKYYAYQALLRAFQDEDQMTLSVYEIKKLVNAGGKLDLTIITKAREALKTWS